MIAATPAARSRQTTQVVVDALREQTGDDLAFNPDGDGFFDMFHHEAVTRYDVYAVMPFHNNVATASLTGAEVQALLKAHPNTVASGDVSRLDAARTYRVALVDYEARSVYKLTGGRLQDTGRDLRAVVIAYLGLLK